LPWPEDVVVRATALIFSFFLRLRRQPQTLAAGRSAQQSDVP
jgi:hypothetical protein